MKCDECYQCLSLVIDEQTKMPVTMLRMTVCPTCGNKRCPKATFHENACTDSNEAGQLGSRFAASY